MEYIVTFDICKTEGREHFATEIPHELADFSHYQYGVLQPFDGSPLTIGYNIVQYPVTATVARIKSGD